LNESCDQVSTEVCESKNSIATCATEKNIGDIDIDYLQESRSKNIIIELNILASGFETCVKCTVCD
jgi:hypothetical protein